MAFGTGSAMARRAVDAVMGPTVVRHETVASTSPSDASLPSSNTAGSEICTSQSKALQDVWFFSLLVYKCLCYYRLSPLDWIFLRYE